MSKSRRIIVKKVAKSGKRKVAKDSPTPQKKHKLCPACGLSTLVDGVCDNCNYGRKAKSTN